MGNNLAGKKKYVIISAMEQKLVILGLGNPGEEYENTYHNVGWLALKYMEDEFLGMGVNRKAGKWNNFNYLEFIDDGKKYILIFPNTYMNLSGKAAIEAIKVFNIKKEDLIVIHDDSDLPVGEIKGATGVGAAGHNGVSSIIENLGTKDFYRIRIGIRNPNETIRKKAEDFVLSKIKKSDMETFYLTFAGLKSKVNEKSTP